ncbi:MAG TPA: HAMP domain-containing protein, partial [Myxococcota bacterium]|nr:HAMP domain-containing protein [Myxococcota bacterium]
MPEKLPVLLNGGMLNRQGDKVKSRVHARAIVVADERSSLALVVVDSCMMPRPLLDEAKALAARRTGIPADRILIAATHSHTAPSSMGCLGTHEDPAYVPVLRRQLVEAIAAATTKVAAGDFTVRVAEGRRDEIGKTATAFNKMTADLGTYRDRLVTETRARENLSRFLSPEVV